jgi:hypothetical protein
MATVFNTMEKRTTNPSARCGNVVESKSQFIIGLKKYLLFPIEAGCYGFYLVFSVILVSKLICFLLGFNVRFNLDLMDVILSLVGFFLMFLIDILKRFQK